MQYHFLLKKKWSGISLKNKGSYVLGAPEFVLKEQFNKYKNEILSYQRKLQSSINISFK